MLFDSMFSTLPGLKGPPRNKAALAFWGAMRGMGFKLVKSASVFPDYLLVDEQGEKKPCFVVIKRKRGHRLKRGQEAVLQFLASKGIDCFRWSPEAGFERISDNTGGGKKKV